MIIIEYTHPEQDVKLLNVHTGGLMMQGELNILHHSFTRNISHKEVG